MSAAPAPSSAPANGFLVPVLELGSGAADPGALTTWRLAVSSLIGAEIPHQLFGLWVYPEGGGAVLLGPEALDQDRLDVPIPDPRVAQDQLYEMEAALRRAKYASALALPVHGAERDVGLALIGTFEPGAFAPARVRGLRALAEQLALTLEPLSRRIAAAAGPSAIAPSVGDDDLPQAIASAVTDAPTGPELVRRLSGLLHAHLPHDRLELLSFANGSGAAVPLSGFATRRRWGTGGAPAPTWGDVVRVLHDEMGTEPAVSIADLAALAPGLSWPAGGPASGPAKVSSVLAAQLVVAGERVGLLVTVHAAADVYRPSDETLAALVARAVAARVAALRLESEVQGLRGQLEVLQAPSLPVLRAAEVLSATAHLGEALHRFGAEVREVVPHDRLRFLLRWSDTEVVCLAADAIRPLPDLPPIPIASLPARPVLEGDRGWLLGPASEGGGGGGGGGTELAVALRVADRTIGAMVLGADRFESPRDAAAVAQQFAAVAAPHLELLRRGAATAARPTRAAAEPVRRLGG
jgi:hypothetical protein